MSRALIQDVNARAAKGQHTVFRVTLSPAQSIAGWGAFQATIREDPSYPRTTADAIAAAKTGDIDISGWTSVATSTSVSVVDSANGVFDITFPRSTMLTLSPGLNRYVIDIWRTDSGAEYQVVPPTWLTILQSVYDG